MPNFRFPKPALPTRLTPKKEALTLISPPRFIHLGQRAGQGGSSTDSFSLEEGQGWPLGLRQGGAGSPCNPAGMLDNELSMTCSHELHANVETTPSVFRNSKYQCFFLSTFIILNWSHKERVAVAVVFKWVEDAFVLRPLLGLLLPGTNVVIKLPSSGNSSLMGNADSF